MGTEISISTMFAQGRQFGSNNRRVFICIPWPLLWQASKDGIIALAQNAIYVVVFYMLRRIQVIHTGTGRLTLNNQFERISER